MNKNFFVILPILALILSGCGNHKESSKSSHINVVSTVDFYGEVAKNIGGKYVNVHNIIHKSSIDPHSFEPTIKTAKVVNNADLLIYNGVGYDGWINKLDTKGGTTKLNIGSKLMHKKDGDNPHLWYNTATMFKLSKWINLKLSKENPNKVSYFKKNYQRYIKKLQLINNKINELKIDSKDAKVDVSEPVFNYMLDRLSYKVNNKEFAEHIENEVDPSPSAIKNLKEDITKRRISFFVNNKQTSNSVVSNFVKLAHKRGIPVVSVTETKPPHTDYVNWMLDTLNDVHKAQKEDLNAKATDRN